MENKTRYITPIVMLTAASVAIIIMVKKDYPLLPMFKTLLVVMLVFYFIGDIARYIYARIRPKVIPDLNLERVNTFNKKQHDIEAGLTPKSDSDEISDDDLFNSEISMDDLQESDSFNSESSENGSFEDEGNINNSFEQVQDEYNDSDLEDNDSYEGEYAGAN